MARLILFLSILTVLACRKPDAPKQEVPVQDTTTLDTSARDTLLLHD